MPQRSGPATVLVAHPGGELYGSDRVLAESVAGLREAGLDVVVALAGPGPLVARLEALGARVTVCRTPVLRKQYLSLVGLLRLARSTAAGLRPSWALLRATRPVAVLVNTVTVPLWIVLARLLRVPVVCHVHEAERSARPLLRRLLALPLLGARRVVTNSRFSEGVLLDAVPSLASRTQVVPNGVEGPSACVPPRASPDGEVRLLYLGRLSPRKGPDVAVAAVAALRDRGVPARLDVVGAVFPGYEWFEQELRDQVRALGLTDRVALHGFRPDVWPWLAGCDVLLVPSRTDEPFGNTAVEGALAARPVVASRTSGLLEATSGLRAARTVAPDDPDAVADAVVAIRDAWAHVRDDALADRAYAADRYSPTAYRRRVADVVAGVVSDVAPGVVRGSRP
ncbi:glycosyltransferase [Aquipuribacter nitratireducens]|uniref:Glycosyltransferase n=1 Tax=Aquipuribacter nitratireducens TaxID=650104 RepID=A0ABW0GPL9_9MICO